MSGALGGKVALVTGAAPSNTRSSPRWPTPPTRWAGMGYPYDDIAPVAVFLASAGSRYLTGNTLFVDGGRHINTVAWAPDRGP